MKTTVRLLYISGSETAPNDWANRPGCVDTTQLSAIEEQIALIKQERASRTEGVV